MRREIEGEILCEATEKKNKKNSKNILNDFKKFLPPMKKKFYAFSKKILILKSLENFIPIEMKFIIPKKI